MTWCDTTDRRGSLARSLQGAAIVLGLFSAAGCALPCGQFSNARHPLLRVTDSSGGPAPFITARTVLEDGQLEYYDSGTSTCARLTSQQLVDFRARFGVGSRFEGELRALRNESEEEMCCDQMEIYFETRTLRRDLLTEDLPESFREPLQEIDDVFLSAFGEVYSTILDPKMNKDRVGLDLSGPPRADQCKREPLRITAEIQQPELISKVLPRPWNQPGLTRPVGVAIFEIVVDRQGVVHSPRVLRSVGSEADSLAAEAIKQWQYKPATCEGLPVAVYFTVTVKFE